MQTHTTKATSKVAARFKWTKKFTDWKSFFLKVGKRKDLSSSYNTSEK